ncbi:predicted protein [Naegleria gruberi]|uniref:Predicted protein n=1 Tax=Naegleria gruberi TaxID=5762 RepID=D2W0Y4_NAEGR|nr:uncharacterized protein NAEGRDRAFT_75023 [Naegleria gruberi]EFC37261.1 predicted protein [Naegleria gruberi]|eukprot:XP_002670005.1 predicted protein [Naegleria gruberi strain NEG-M]
MNRIKSLRALFTFNVALILITTIMMIVLNNINCSSVSELTTLVVPFSIKIEEKDDKLRIGLNTNFYDCLVDEDFDIEPDCDILTGNVIFVYESPGERSIFLRNVFAAGMLVLIVACCCCVAVCVFGCYCCFIRRRKLLQGSIR